MPRKESKMLPPLVEQCIASKEPFLWLNDGWLPLQKARAAGPLGLDHVLDAERRLGRFMTLLAALFPELAPTGGLIESPLYPGEPLRQAMMGGRSSSGWWFIKGDHALPVAGSIKARGGIYEVLVHAENLGLRAGLIGLHDDPVILASPRARALFARHQVAVGSTGNLGLSIGTMAAALGFRAVVHMSSDAKEWKKARLRACGVEVVEHQGDYGAAVAAGREQAQRDPQTYFVDDENSQHLFLGYSVGAVRLKQQLDALGIEVSARRPLFVYLPCGVGGAPGGITFGLRHLFGDDVHCFFAEPTAAPCMLIRLAAIEDRAISVREIGLDNCTEADGLAVAQASEFVAGIMKPLVSGIFTVTDGDLLEDLYVLETSAGLRIEPSAAAAFRGPRWLLESAPGQEYLRRRGLQDQFGEATHVLWTTGGALVPQEEYWGFHERGRQARAAGTGGVVGNPA